MVVLQSWNTTISQQVHQQCAHFALASWCMVQGGSMTSSNYCDTHFVLK